MFYLFTRRNLPGPGAQAYALATYQIPPQDNSGGGRWFFGQMNPLQDLTTQNQVAMTVGLGGQYQGQFVGQPLIDLSQVGQSSEEWQTGEDDAS